jgi:hypothetical protein
MADLTAMMQAAAGAAGDENLYIEDVFSTYLYTGNGSTQTITNDIDLDGEGGLVWGKSRSNAYDNFLVDSARGITKFLTSNETREQQTDANVITAFNSNGFSLGVGGAVSSNNTGATFASWTFRKAPKFFDVVTYTGTGANRTVSHNLGSVPGCIIVKRTDTTGDWQVYHRANTASPETDYLVLNSTAATADSNTRWNDTQPTDAVFSLGTEATVNASGGTYVAYLFAHDDGGFGDDGSENVISCGSFTYNSSSGNTINLGYEPQWILVKSATDVTQWYMQDTMRGMASGPDSGARLFPNLSSAEDTSFLVGPTATGFNIKPGFFSNGNNIIYIAIRRGPMKVPTTGTSVFTPIARTGTGANATVTSVGFPVDLLMSTSRQGFDAESWWDRLRNSGGAGRLLPSSTSAEIAGSTDSLTGLDVMDGFKVGVDTNGRINFSLWTYVYHCFRRAPGFFDVVCYTGTGSATTFSHNLGVVPELMIMKKRSATDDWAVYAGDNTDFLLLNTTAATADDNTYWNDTTPTSSVFSVGTNADVNTSAATYVAYLFASLAGVSKVGSYTGNGTSVSVTTGFQPRFILVKRTDSTGNWIVGDSARGLVAGDDPFLLLNSTAAEVTNQDWVDVSATGFTINETAANANVNTGTYIYLAIS